MYDKPRVQLFIIVGHKCNYSVDDIDKLVNEYTRVDILLVNKNKQFFYEYMTKKGFSSAIHIHVCYDSVEKHINQLIDLDCDFYAVSTNKKDFPAGFVADLDKYLDKADRYLMMIKPKDNTLSGMVINTLLSRYLCHNGKEQSIQEKCEIHLLNHDNSQMFFQNIDDFYKKLALKDE